MTTARETDLSAGAAKMLVHGKNSRQRRAAKRSAARERRSRLRPGGPAADNGSRTDTRFRGGATNPFTRVEDSPSVGRLRREQAERCLQRLLLARGSAQGLAHLVEQELISLQSQDLRKLDELVTVRLQYIVAQLWERGWQPLDLLHVVHNAGPRLAPIIAAVITTQVKALHALSRAPQDWLNQLQVVADEARELAAGNDQQAGWLLVVAMCKSGLGLVQAWVEIITVAGLISTRTAGTGADSAAPV